MPAVVSERELLIPVNPLRMNILEGLREGLSQKLAGQEIPLRLAVTASEGESYHCEVSLLSGWEGTEPESLFRFVRRPVENSGSFNCLLLVPTGIGAEIGGHAGDATPVASLLAATCDTLITHPNVLNASDIIQIPSNALYVEGSVITRLLMGSIGLQPVRNNRMLVVLGAHEDELFIHAAINSVNAARASYGLMVPAIARLGTEFEMEARYVGSGRAAGQIKGMGELIDLLDRERNAYDAVAITSQIAVPPGFHTEYFESNGEMVNPWGGVEAMLTHAISTLYDVPSAHAPMLETQEIANADPGIVDPRMAAEGVSLALIQCILKGLQRSPRIVADTDDMRHHSVLTAADVSCLVIPDGCLGMPVLAALEQGITVIAVRENRNLMKNNLRGLPWEEGQFYQAENYWEAAGVMAALKAGIEPYAVRRPIRPAPVHEPNEQ